MLTELPLDLSPIDRGSCALWHHGSLKAKCVFITGQRAAQPVSGLSMLTVNTRFRSLFDKKHHRPEPIRALGDLLWKPALSIAFV